MLVGTVLFVEDCVYWYGSQDAISLYTQSEKLSLVGSFYVLLVLAVGVMLIGMYGAYRYVLSSGHRRAPETISILGVLSDAISSKKSLRMGIVAAVVYGLAFAIVSGIIVYQPTVNFSLVYDVASPQWNAAACCGTWGTVPAAIFFVSPNLHLALEFIPLSLLLALLVPLLVGLNVTVALFAIRSRGPIASIRWVGFLGGVVGFFTGCPTCAGLFLASAFGSLGVPSVAVALAPYQTLLVAVSIPILLAGPILTAFALKRSMYASCRLPVRNQVGGGQAGFGGSPGSGETQELLHQPPGKAVQCLSEGLAWLCPKEILDLVSVHHHA